MGTNVADFRIDPYAPAEMAQRASTIGTTKARLDAASTFALALMAGAFIAIGAVFSTVASTDTGFGFGVTRLLAGFTFSLGLILVVVAGAELFTGNNLIVMAWVSGRVTLGQLLRNWAIVYAGNLVGSVVTAVVIFYTAQYALDGYKVGATALNIANSKVNLDFVTAFARGIVCNALVCLAVWLCYSARSTTDKILAIVPPITAFVAASFEHSIANMYFIPLGIFIRDVPEVLQAAGKTGADLANLTWWGCIVNNLIPVTIGNIIGGAGLVGLLYWFVYLRQSSTIALRTMVDLSLRPPVVSETRK